MKKLLLLLLFFGLLKPEGFAQQDAQYSQYMFNSLVINPAYAGYKESYNVSLLNRNQWVGIKGAPKTQTVVLDGAFFDNQKVGLGLTIVNDKIGIQGQTAAYANYSYRLPVGDDNSRLAFGLAVGVSQYTLNSDQATIDDPSDPNFNDGKQSYFAPDAKFGLFYNTEKFYAGASVTNLLSSKIDFHNTGNNIVDLQSRHYFLTAGYLFDLNPALKLKPSVMLRDDEKGPTNLDVNSFLLINDAIWLGASYRTGINLKNASDINSKAFKKNSLVGLVEVYVAKKFRLGYAYDHTLSDLADYAGGTHEISLGMTLKTKKNSNAIPTPRYF